MFCNHQPAVLSHCYWNRQVCSDYLRPHNTRSLDYYSGGLIITSFPLPGVTPRHVQPQLRIPSLAQTGAVKCAEWTADGCFIHYFA